MQSINNANPMGPRAWGTPIAPRPMGTPNGAPWGLHCFVCLCIFPQTALLKRSLLVLYRIGLVCQDFPLRPTCLDLPSPAASGWSVRISRCRLLA